VLRSARRAPSERNGYLYCPICGQSSGKKTSQLLDFGRREDKKRLDRSQQVIENYRFTDTGIASALQGSLFIPRHCKRGSLFIPRHCKSGRRSSAEATTSNGSSVEMTGTVKWFNADRGYGFITPNGGGKDVFVHVSALERSGIEGLSEGQTVVLDVVEGRKGPEATRVRLI
jgi:cold shock CspA family protein